MLSGHEVELTGGQRRTCQAACTRVRDSRLPSGLGQIGVHAVRELVSRPSTVLRAGVGDWSAVLAIVVGAKRGRPILASAPTEQGRVRAALYL